MLNLPAAPPLNRISSGSSCSGNRNFQRLSTVIAETVRNTPSVEVEIQSDTDVESPVQAPAHMGRGRATPVERTENREEDNGPSKAKKMWIAIGIAVALIVVVVVVAILCRPKKLTMEEQCETIMIPNLRSLEQPASDKRDYSKTLEFSRDQGLQFTWRVLIGEKGGEGKSYVKRPAFSGFGPEAVAQGVKEGWRIDEVDGQKINTSAPDSGFGPRIAEVLSQEGDTYTIKFNTYLPGKGRKCENGHIMEKVRMANRDEANRFLSEGYGLLTPSGMHCKSFKELQRDDYCIAPKGFSCICDCCHASNLKTVYHCYECGKEENGSLMFDKCESCYRDL